MKSSFKKNESQKTSKEDIFKTFFGHPEFDDILFYIFYFYKTIFFILLLLNFHTYF